MVEASAARGGGGDRAGPGGGWLLVKNLLFTVVAPGTVGVYLPLALAPAAVPAGAPRRAAGIVLLAAGAAVYAWCVWNFAIVGRGTPAPIDPPRRLIVAGPHRHVRNPMYLAVLAVIAGWAMLFASRRLAGYGAVVALAFHLFVLLYEEPALAGRFGAEYGDYRRRVRRWLPRIRAMGEDR